MGKMNKTAVFVHITQRSKPGKNGCLLWTGSTTGAGYGNMKLDGKTVAVHRAMWEAGRGPIPKDKWLRHRCENRLCVNLDHMWLGPRGRLRSTA